MRTVEDLRDLDPWLTGLIDQLDPRALTRVARVIGQRLRRENSRRIAANVEPDGSPMEPRKPKQEKPLPDWLVDRIAANPSLRKKFPARAQRRRQKMFPRLRLARAFSVKPDADGVEVGFSSRAASTARVHHYGLTDSVSDRRGALRVRYPARRLLGFAPGDANEIMETVLDHLDKMDR